MIDALRTHAITKPKGALNSYGTAVLINILNEAGGLPTRNFSSGRFEGAAKIAGEAIFEGNKTTPGQGTLQPCLQPRLHHPVLEHLVQRGWQGAHLLRRIRIGLGAGRRLRHRQPGRHRRDDQLCNDYGLDTIETGTTIARGHGSRRDPVRRRQRAPSNWCTRWARARRWAASWAAGRQRTGKVYGVTHVPTVKGQGMPAYEPRAVKGIGITYATTTMGADHTAGYTICPGNPGRQRQAGPAQPRGQGGIEPRLPGHHRLHRLQRSLPVHRLRHPGYRQRLSGHDG